MIKLNNNVKELLKAVGADERVVAECIDAAQKGLSSHFSFSLPVSTKYGVPITIELSYDDCVLEPDYNKWYDKEDFDKFELPENSAIIEITDSGVVLSEESKYISELADDTVKFMVIDLNGVLD